MYLGTDGISCGTAFKVTKAGALTCTSGTIGGFTINSTSLKGTSVIINPTGITLADGAKVVGGDGVYCNLQFFPPAQYSNVGYYVQQYEDIYQEMVKIYADIPSNFVVQSAYITIRHQPIVWNYYASLTATSTTTTTGYARNVQIYEGDITPLETIYIDSEFSTYPASMEGTNTKAMGSSGKTFSSSSIEVYKSSDLSSYLTPRKSNSI